MKKLDIKGMSRKSKALVITAAVIAVTVGIGGYFTYQYYNTSDPLTRQLGVKDATEKNGGLQSPYNVSKENFDKAIKDNKYLGSKYDITDNITEQLSNMDNRDTFKVERDYSLVGMDKDGGSVDKDKYTRNFYSNIKTYDKFNNPSSLTLVYGYADEDEADSIKDSYKEIITKLFNKDIADYIANNNDTSYTKDVKSKSGNYNLKLTKGVEDVAGHKQLTIVVNFDKSTQEPFDLESFKYESADEPLYSKLPFLDGVAIKDMPNKYSDIVGNYASSRLTLLLNKVDNNGDTKRQTSAFTVRTVYNDNSATAVEYTISETKDKDGNIAKASLNANTSVRYYSEPSMVMDEAIKVASGILGEDITPSSSDTDDNNAAPKLISPTDEERKSGSLERDITKSLCGYDFKIHVSIQTVKDAKGTYGVIKISGN